ncbi:MAG: UMP kinase [Candidatus Aenigmarchaeota archaeon]|nr:UMP kinase [Candidatus Aenigmarchaeota archaeon]
MKIVFDIGGSVLCSEGTPKEEMIRHYSEFLLSLTAEGHEIVVIVGGGRLARNYIDISGKFSDERDFLDNIGIHATRLNAMVLISSLGEHANKKVPASISELKRSIGTKKITVMGGLKPRQTTDAVSVQAAKVLGADLILICTDVNGIYDKNPKHHYKVKMFLKISPAQVNKIIEKDAFIPGHSSVIDPVAVKLLMKNKIKAIVLNGKDIENIRNAIKGNEFLGTTVE